MKLPALALAHRAVKPEPEPQPCPACGTPLALTPLREALYVCPACGNHLPMPAAARIAMLTDRRSFRELGRTLISVDPLQFMDQRPYRERLAEARARTGLREAALAGEARLDRRPFVLIVLDFSFMGGSMGSVVGEKVAAAFEHATRKRLPVVSVAASGGARMQEGMLSLMQMAKTAAAVARHDRAGLAYVSILANPTFGGVAASFASLGDVLIAEPGAQIGFAGPRVIEQTIGETLPPDSHRAETLLDRGMVDLVLARAQQRETVAYLLGHLQHGRRVPLRGEGRPGRVAGPGVGAWEAVTLARHAGRPTALDYIERIFTGFVELRGDRASGDDPAIVGGLAELGGQTVVVIGQERGGTPDEQARRRRGMAMPEGYREARRLMALAAKFELPVITFVDTPGAFPGYDAEQRGIAQTLARNLLAMSSLPTPIVSVVIGEGGSGGALALAVADKVLMLENAIYSVISPEGASAILYRDQERARDVAERLKLTASDLLRLGIIDQIVPEPPGGAHTDHDAAAREVRRHIVAALAGLRGLSADKLVARRYEKYRHMGRVGAYWREVVSDQAHDLLEYLARRVQRHQPT